MGRIAIGMVVAAAVLLLIAAAAWLMRGLRRNDKLESAETQAITEEQARAGVEASAASISSEEDEGEEMPVPEKGMIGLVTDPIPGRGYGEIKIPVHGVELYFMAACRGEDWVEAGEAVVVEAVLDGVVYVDKVGSPSVDVDKD
jgi:hypothetical protein